MASSCRTSRRRDFQREDKHTGRVPGGIDRTEPQGELERADGCHPDDPLERAVEDYYWGV